MKSFPPPARPLAEEMKETVSPPAKGKRRAFAEAAHQPSASLQAGSRNPED